MLDAQGRLAALVTRANVLSFIKDTSCHDRMLVEALGGRKLVVGYPEVPIIDPADHRLVGLVARKDLLRVRARLLSEERERRRVMAFGRRRQAEASHGPAKPSLAALEME